MYRGTRSSSRLANRLRRFASLALLGVLCLALVPTLVGGAGTRIRHRTWPSFGWGALVGIGVPMVLTATVAFAGLAARFAQGRGNRFIGVLVGVLAIVVLATIPVLGQIVSVFVVLVGLGGLLLALRGGRRVRRIPLLHVRARRAGARRLSASPPSSDRGGRR